MPYKSRHPHIRVTEMADAKAQRHVDALVRQGIATSKTAWISELIMSLPEPANGQAVTPTPKTKQPKKRRTTSSALSPATSRE